MASKLKTPISYYGGKQKLCKKIVSLFPSHTLYCEPFIGGGAVFFGKEPSQLEVLNDTNRELINFYRVMQQDFVSLEREIRITLHSRRMHADAATIYNSPHLFTDIKRAWAVWVLAAQSFSCMLDGTFGYDKAKNTTTKKIINKRDSFTEELAIRLQNVNLECADANYVIRSRDTVGSFFYCDPPYFNSNCGHYDGYTLEDFEILLTTLSGIQGKFLLSSYPSNILLDYLKRFGWHMLAVEQNVTVNAKSGYVKKKTEVLTSNFLFQ